MNIQESIKKKSEELIRKAQILLTIEIDWEQPIFIKCAELHSKYDLNTILKVFENYTSLPAVYYFEIVSKHNGQDIVNALFTFKKKKLRSCPKIDRNRCIASRYLYCGSKKNGLHGRFIEHLGFGSPNTYALQFFYWAKDIKLELKFHYAWLEENHKEFTELIESALADKIIPLVGKIA